MDATQDDVVDDALDRLHRRGEEWLGGLTSHATMVAEALEHAGRSEAVAPFVADYLDRLEAPMPPTEPIDPRHWRDRLGQRASTTDWVAFFRTALADDGWESVVATWVPRFVPGAVTAATHGLIRTSHAVRSLSRRETAPRVEELAHALGYWAACWATLPVGMPRGDLPFAEALRAVPLLPPDRRTGWLITDRIERIDPVSFAAAIRRAAPPTDPVAGAVEVAHLGAALLAANPGADIPFIHAVTAPTAVIALAPHLPERVSLAAVGEAFKAVAALWATYGEAVPSDDDHRPPARPTVDAAIASGDEHQIKLAVAARDLAALSP